MNLQGARARTWWYSLCLVVCLGIFLGPKVVPADATTPEKTDVMFVFDTSGSMSGVLGEAKEEIAAVIKQISGTVPNVAFGVANVEDYPDYNEGVLEEELTETQYEEGSEKPWRLDQSVTTEQSQVLAAIEGLSGSAVAHGGGDAPEAYGRALWETDTNPQVGWRSGARHEIILIADQVPHATDVNEGIPEAFWQENPFDTHEELPGKWGIPGTLWRSGDSTQLEADLQQLVIDGKPLEMVDYHDTEGDYVNYWEHWAGETGGQAIEAQEGGKELATKLISQIEAGTTAALPPCPAGEARDSNEQCVATPSTPPVPASATWTGKPIGWSADPYVPGPVLSKLKVDDSLTPSATASDTLLPPSITPGLPVSVSVNSSAGEVTLNLVTGATSGSAGLVASPPSLQPPSASELLDAIHPQSGWFTIPLGKASRSLTLTLRNISPLSFAATLENELSAKYQLSQVELEALAGVAVVAVIIASLPEDAAAAATALVADGISITVGAITDAIERVVVPVLERAVVSLVTSIPGDLVGVASTVWGSLTRGIASLAASRVPATPLPVEGPPTSVAHVLTLRARDLHGLSVQHLQGALAKAARESLLSLPVSTTVGPLVVSRHLPHGGGAITLLGGDLPGRKAQLLIAGPGYAAVRDVRVTHGLAGGRIVLPRARHSGRWYFGIVDYGALHSSHGHVRGHAILEGASLVTSR